MPALRGNTQVVVFFPQSTRYPKTVTVTNRILLQVAAATGMVIAVGTAMTYRLVLRSAERQAISHLSDFVAERARFQESEFLKVEQNLKMVRGLFLKRLAQPNGENLDLEWNRRFDRYPDGAWRTKKEFSDGRKFASSWIGKNAPLTVSLKARLLLAEDICQDFLPGWVDAFPSLYFIFPEQANIGFDPRIPNWVWDAPADYDTCASPYFQEATPERNPSRRVVWGSSTREPISQVPYVNVTLPIEHLEKFIGIVGHDIAVRDLLADTARVGLPGVQTYIFRADGRLIANPSMEARILGSDGKLTLQESGDRTLQSLYDAVGGRRETLFAGSIDGDAIHFAAATLQGPGWYYVSVLPNVEVRQQAFQSAKWVLWSGLASLGGVLGFFAIILRRQIARPLGELARATSQMSSGDTGARAKVPAGDELGSLAESFNEMAARVAQRDAELRRLNQVLEQRVIERTAQLQESEARLSTILNNTPSAITTMDADTGRFVDANERALQFFGVSRETILKLSPAELSPPRQPDGRLSELVAMEKIREALEGGFPVFEWTHLDDTGQPVPCEIRLARMPAARRNLVVGNLLNITERKRVEARLLQSEVETLRALAREKELSELKSNFVSMVSHEFRTPLGVIMSATEVLRRYFDRLPAEKRERHLEMIFRSTRNLGHLIEEVLLLAKVEGGHIHFTPKRVDLLVLCRTVVDEVMSATQSVCPIQLHISGGLEGAVTDESLFRHVFTNLLSNAVKYSEPGSSVQFRSERNGSTAVFTVRDQGIGIPPEDQSRIFTSFNRGQNVGGRPGTGLGLVIVQRCVQLHGGEIQVRSELGRGTTVTVTLPLFSPPTST